MYITICPKNQSTCLVFPGGNYSIFCFFNFNFHFLDHCHLLYIYLVTKCVASSRLPVQTQIFLQIPDHCTFLILAFWRSHPVDSSNSRDCFSQLYDCCCGFMQTSRDLTVESSLSATKEIFIYLWFLCCRLTFVVCFVRFI